MLPKFFDIPIPFLGSVPLNSFGFMIMVGFLLATWLTIRRMRRVTPPLDPGNPAHVEAIALELVLRKQVPPSRLPLSGDIDLGALGVGPAQIEEARIGASRRRVTDFVLDFAIVTMLAGLVGAKLVWAYQYPNELGASLALFDLTDGGLSPLGALAGLIPPLFYWFSARDIPRYARRPLWTIAGVSFAALVFALIGTRVAYVWAHDREYEQAIRSLRNWQSGFVLYGGVLPAFLVGVFFIRWRGFGLLSTADLIAPGLMICQGFGRIGCFLNGCCYGAICKDLPWCISYPNSPDFTSLPWIEQQKAGLPDLPSTHSFPVHPVQLYEALACFAIAWGAWKLYDRKLPTGWVFFLTAIGYSVWRFLAEMLRGDPRPNPLFPDAPVPPHPDAPVVLYFSQIISIVIALCSLGFLWYLAGRKKQPAPTPAASAGA